MTITRRMTLATAVAASLAAPAITRAQAKHQWRVQGYLPASFTEMEMFKAWGEELKGKSGGQIEIELLPVGAVVPVTDTLDAMRSGVLAGHFTGSPYFAGKDPAFAVIGDTLAAYENAAQRDRWFEEGGGTALARKLYARFGAHYVGNVYTPEEWLPAKKPLYKLEDLRGIKIRAPQGTVSELFRRAGAGVVVLPFTEVFNALDSGVIDASDAAWIDLNDKLGMHKVVKYEIYARHSMGAIEFVVAQPRWNALSAEQKRLVETELRGFSRKMKEHYDRVEIGAMQRVQAQGVTLIRWAPEEYVKVRQILLAIWKDMSAQSASVKEIVDSHLAFMKKLGLSS